MSDAPVIVTGITTGIQPQSPVSALPQRLEWQQFVQNPQYLTLYVNALQQFMGMDQSEVTSYFQIGGIHGLPYTPWDGVKGDNPTAGYCNHGMNTFPTWHRPYVALYEQLLAGFFPGIVSQYSASNASVGQALQSAAQTWRLPYWDWAINTSIPTEWTSSSTIQILGTDGNPTSVANPFTAYQFNPIDPSFAGYVPPNYPDYSQWPTTIRQPTDPEDPNATSQPAVSNQQLSTTDFKALILDLFPSQLFEPDPWGQFSNHTWDSIHSGQPTLTSLEGIHDTIHTDVGGYGHMGDPAVAAFDPIFWLHHCQVDRLLCLWQAAYPTVYVSAGPDMAGTFVHRPDRNSRATDINVNTPLEPFWKSQSDFATSTDCQSTAAYGYTYPEIAAAGPVPSDQLAEKIYNAVQAMYSEGNFFSTAFVAQPPQAAQVSTDEPAPAPQAAQTSQSDKLLNSLFHGFQKFTITKPMAKPTIHENLVRLPKHAPPSNPHPPANPAPHTEDYVVTPDTYQDWTANATLEKYALGGSGQVCFFLGPASEIPTNPKDWFTSPLIVGKFGIFASNPTITGCDNCKTQEALHTRIGGTVHLTKALIRHHVPLVGNAPVEYLKENLHWRASTVAGVEVPIADIPSLKVVVQSAGYRLPPAGGVGARPIKLPWARHAPITSGKPGGVDHGDDFNQ